ncbi:MAG: DGQHR domain-containing protein [Gammaproteobacteria bacterium]|nr:DGQHR domain-containing protein [Gammaproteobacteria bacterium]MCY4228466.1 DGQHR domain-containing protein [Gammaproteobacteria bacterium]
MTDTNNDDLTEIIMELDEAKAREYRALRQLLDKQLEKSEHLVALSTRMGSTDSYIASVPLDWINNKVRFARQLPIFKEHLSEKDGTISINSSTIHHLQQREPDHSRQLPMAMYLAIRKHHKFGSLTIVAYQDWVDPNVNRGNSEKWGKDGRALESSLSIQSLDRNLKIIDLDTARTNYFALDGQHRLLAIQGLMQLLKTGRLEAKTKDGKSLPKKAITEDDLDSYYQGHGERLGLNRYGYQTLLNESMGVEIIPAVQAGETYEEATSRLRNIFVDINENAKRLEKGELTLLDENNGFRIVSRILITEHPLFRSSDGIRVNIRTPNVTKNSDHYTTLQTVVEIAREYLKVDSKFESWKSPILGESKFGYLRPEEEDIEEALRRLKTYFDAIMEVPSHEKMIQGTTVKDLRSPEKEDNILFWPIAQQALANAIADLEIEKRTPLKHLIQLLSKHEKLGKLRLTAQDAPWFGVLCDPIDKNLRKTTQYQTLCSRLFIYLLGGGIEDDEAREQLKKDFFDARKVSVEEGEESKAHDGQSGTLHKFENFKLPHPWQ